MTLADALPTRALGPFQVTTVGLGCMNVSHGYGPPLAEQDAEALIRAAIDEEGLNWLDTAALYGFGANERLVARVLKQHRSRLVLCSKGGMFGVEEGGRWRRVIDGRPEAIRRHCEQSLQRLGTEAIDVYYLHRWDKNVPIEESVGAMARLKQEGKVRALGLSEVSAATLRRAHREHPIAALQSEYSLWVRNPELGALAACRELGVAFVAFAPLGRGFLAGFSDLSTLHPGDIRLSMPRFQPAAHAHNLGLMPAMAALAREAGLTPGQLALAWLLSQGDAGLSVLAIPGTTRRDHLHENARAALAAPPAELLRRAGELLHPDRIVGDRYHAATLAEVDTEEPPPRPRA